MKKQPQKQDITIARLERQHTGGTFNALFSISNAVNITLDLNDLYRSTGARFPCRAAQALHEYRTGEVLTKDLGIVKLGRR